MKYYSAAILLLFLGGCGFVAIEQPKYSIIEDDGQVQVRQYEQTLIAKTIVDKPDLESASNEGFRRIAAFIFGANTTQQKIAMTAPVTSSVERSEKIAMTAPVSTQGSSGNYVIAFTMPSAYTHETLPIPNDSSVIIEEVVGKKMAVLKYSGTWSQQRMDDKISELISWIDQKKYSPVGQPIFARYDPPFMPWFLRRNEVQIEIE